MNYYNITKWLVRIAITYDENKFLLTHISVFNTQHLKPPSRICKASKNMNEALDSLKEETKRSKSELIKLAIENYLAMREELKLQKAVEMMRKEHEPDDELTAFTLLDSEDFFEKG
jgi:predicted DNA-binding protein